MRTRLSKIFHIFLAAALILFPPLRTYSMQSTNYGIEQDSINFGGTEGSASTSYRLSDTMGEVGTGESQAGCYAMSFDGTDDYVDIADDANLEPQDAATFSFWLYPTSWAQDPTAVSFLVKRSSTSNGYFIFYFKSTGTLNFDFGGSASRWNTGYNPPLNTWSHIVLTRNASGRKLYVDGAYFSQTSITDNPASVPSSGNLYMGRNSESGYFYQGKMDDTRIYNRALSETEITDLYKGSQVDSTGLVGHWNFNEGSGTTAADLSGNNNTGTIYGATFSTDTPAATCKILNAGYRTMDETYIAMTDPADVVMSPDLGGMTGGTSYGSTSWNVTTDSHGGYQVSVRASTSPALMSGAESFANYTPTGDAPDFGWSIANTDSEFGFTIEGGDTIGRFLDNGSVCSVGSGNIADRCWGPFTTDNQVVAGSYFGNHPLGTETTIKLRAQSGTSHIQSDGLYQATITVTALAL